jgi:hypothetical protein
MIWRMSAERIITVTIAALVGGLVGGASVHLLKARSDKPARPAASAAVDPDSDPEDTAARLDEIEARLAALQRQKSNRQALDGYPAAAAARSDAGADAIPGGAADPQNPAFDLAVRGVMDRIEQEREQERQVERAARWQERAKRFADRLMQSLGLSERQRTDVERILLSQMQQLSDQRRNGADGGAPLSRDQRRAQAAQIRQQTETELAGVLDARQLDEYKKLRDEGELGDGFGPRPPPGERALE